jgi:hypothetical protein
VLRGARLHSLGNEPRRRDERRGREDDEHVVSRKRREAGSGSSVEAGVIDRAMEKPQQPRRKMSMLMP